MSTLTATQRDAREHSRDVAGKFGIQAHSAPEVGLESAADPQVSARDFIRADPPTDLTESQLRGYASANELIDDESLRQQPLSYLAFHAGRAQKAAANQAATAAEGDAHDFSVARARRLDEIADELHRLAGISRHPVRNPENVGSSVEDGERVLYVTDYVYGRLKTQLHPKGLTETRRALSNKRGETQRAMRVVYLDWESVPPTSAGAPLDVVGPKDGRPLVVHVRAGAPTMNVVSGNVIIEARGNGFGIHVKDGARARVIAVPGHKVGVTAEPGSIVDLYAEEGSRGSQHIQPGAIFRLHGESDDITLSTDAR
jgi:hypothetical protein